MTVKWLGAPDQYIPGIKPQDLTDEEWEALPPERKKYALESGLYRIEKSKANKSEVSHDSNE
jgi:hypothetical protein